jgi:hypothetical protein
MLSWVSSFPHLKCCSLKETATSSFLIICHSKSSSHLTQSHIGEKALHVYNVSDFGAFFRLRFEMCVIHLGLLSFCSVPFVSYYSHSHCVTYVTQLSMCLIMLSPENGQIQFLQFYVVFRTLDNGKSQGNK